jgi:hypothetical protein
MSKLEAPSTSTSNYAKPPMSPCSSATPNFCQPLLNFIATTSCFTHLTEPEKNAEGEKDLWEGIGVSGW